VYVETADRLKTKMLEWKKTLPPEPDAQPVASASAGEHSEKRSADAVPSNPDGILSGNVDIYQSDTAGVSLQSRHVSAKNWRAVAQSFKWESDHALDGIGLRLDSTQPVWKRDQQYELIIQELDGYRGVPSALVYRMEFTMQKDWVGPNRWLYLGVDDLNLEAGQWYGFAVGPTAEDRKGDLVLFVATSGDDAAYARGSANQFNPYDPDRGWPPSGPYGSARRDLAFYFKFKEPAQ